MKVVFSRFKSLGAVGIVLGFAAVSACNNDNDAAIEVGQMLCGDTHPYTCPTDSPTPWGIVIYADPNPQTSGYYGLAMSTEDVVQGFNGDDGAGTAWATSALQNTDISANHSGIYAGINGTFKDDEGDSQDGNTKIYCDYSDNDCSVPTDAPGTSAFNACVNYSNGPSLAGGWYLPSVAEVAQMFLFAQTQVLNLSTAGVETFDSYWYWSSTQHNGSTNASDLGNLGYDALAGDPMAEAFYFGFIDGIHNHQPKNQTYGVRCVQALPI